MVSGSAQTLPKGCLFVLAEMIGALGFNEARLHASAAEGFATATDVAEYLVRKGMPFREAHEVTGKLVAYCIVKDKALAELKLSEFKKASTLIGRDVFAVLRVEDSVASRDSEGGTSIKEVKKALARLKRKTA